MKPFTNYGTEEALYHPMELAYAQIIPKRSINRYCNEMPQKFVVKNKKIVIFKSNTKATMFVNLVTVDGMRYILRRTRRRLPDELLCMFNINAENKFYSEEAKWLEAITEAFQGEKIVFQHAAGPYKIDAYFPKYNIVIEVDEPYHKYYKFMNQLERTVALNFILKNPTIIRIDLSGDVSIFKIINKICRAIFSMRP